MDTLKTNPSEGVSNHTSETSRNNNLNFKLTRQLRRKMDREIQSMLEESGCRVISFQQLKEISDSNYGRFNRNVDHQMLKKDFPSIVSDPILIENIMSHHHYNGERVETHFRCGITISGLSNTVFQDISIDQSKEVEKNEWMNEDTFYKDELKEKLLHRIERSEITEVV